MSTAWYISLFGISILSNFVGFLVNLFMTVVIYKTWIKTHRISSSDRILFSLSITRFLMLALILLNTLRILSNVEISVYSFTVLLLCWRFLDCCSLWLVTLLNGLYCVKITNFQCSVFLLLKRSISTKITRMLLGCLLLPAFTTLLCVVVRLLPHLPEFVTGRNDTLFDLKEDILTFAISFVLSSLLQFILNVTFASLLIHSLRQHLQRMQRNSTSFWNPQTGAHVGAMKLMICFLILYIPYSVANMLHLPSFVMMDFSVRAICVMISTIYLPGHSILIILTHLKLRTKAKKILCFKK
ncbi:taste receptor type 2 member 4 [Perognathus longimembris pacificus]|uniref:taste receptor type 2 member 4 n=1 Tax=Perognathus longimembris pacificus TaxID=214514 RepID=UPI00201A074E|nr:taste receptor type 2 member 4 [Perognathus longimembris pacificus]